MDTRHTTQEIMSKEAIEFGEWVSRVAVPALRTRRDSERLARAVTLRDMMEGSRLMKVTRSYTCVQWLTEGF